jgi:hypothetical protein
LHRFQEGRLRFRRSAVDFVGQQHLAKDQWTQRATVAEEP